MSLPKEINVMKVVTYEVEQILEDIWRCDGKKPDEVDSDYLIKWIEDWVLEDFNGDYDLIYQDENGNEL